jgi:hypothetical protein
VPYTVLIVTGSGDIALSELLIRALDEPDITVIPKTNAESALNYIKATPPDFIVASFTLAADRNAPVEPGGGMLFCEAARAISAAPMALVTSAVTNAVQQRVSRMASPPICVTVDADLPAMLLVQIRAIREELLRLDITIRADPAGEWSYDLHGTGFEFERSGRLNVPASLLVALKTVALALSEAKESWREIFYGLGKSIVDGFCADNPMFGEQLRAGLEAAGGLANTRVTFIVADALYEIALEAISSPVAELPEPWMIHAPLVRSIAGVTPANTQLFDGPPRPLRCLILCADASGIVDTLEDQGRPLNLAVLPHVRKECEEVRRLFSRIARQHKFEEPRVVGGVDGAPLTEQRLLDVLREPTPWDVVHYAGHSYHSRDNPGRASLIVGERARPVAVRINEVAPYLRRSKLVYLSSCNSGNAGFAFEAARQGIPAIVGFRWGVRDDYADIHARLFYRKLFKDRAIDTALWKTRRAMHRFMRDDRTWASSMLVMQSH